MGSELGELGVDKGEARGEGGGCFVGGGFEFGLLGGGEPGDRRAGVLVFLEDEFRLERFVPALALDGEGFFEGGDAVADFLFFGIEAGAGDLDFRGAVFFDDGRDGITEKEQDERVGDGDAHQDGDHKAEGKLSHFPEDREIWAIAGEQGAVDGQDDERPDGGDGEDDGGFVGDGGKRVGAGDEGKGAGDEDRGAKGHVFALFPGWAAFESFGSSTGEPEKRAFDGVHKVVVTGGIIEVYQRQSISEWLTGAN